MPGVEGESPASDRSPGPIEHETDDAVDASQAMVRRRWALTLAAGLFAGLLAWLGGEGCLNAFKPPRHAVNSKGIVLNMTDRREAAGTDARNAGLAFVILGIAFGAAMGAAGGFSRRSPRSALLAALAGTVLGAGVAAGTSFLVLPRYNAYRHAHPDEALQDLVYPLLVHVVIWSSVGAAGGAAHSMGLGSRRALTAITLGGLAGAALGAIVFELIGAIALPQAQTARFVSSTASSRLLARLMVCVLAAVGVALAAAAPQAERRPDTT